jgi:uncharacterized membrane protein (UPF0127 family)
MIWRYRVEIVETSIQNLTRKTVLAERSYWATRKSQQAVGFMFRKPRDTLVFLFMPQRKETIHMWFVFGSIDVLALDGTGKVIALRQNLRPWHWWNPGMQMSAIIECPVGTISRTGTQLGDRIAMPQPHHESFWRWYHHALFWFVQVGIPVLIGLLIAMLLL